MLYVHNHLIISQVCDLLPIHSDTYKDCFELFFFHKRIENNRGNMYELYVQNPSFTDFQTAQVHTGSTIMTLLHEKIHPKNWQVSSPLVM